MEVELEVRGVEPGRLTGVRNLAPATRLTVK